MLLFFFVSVVSFSVSIYTFSFNCTFERDSVTLEWQICITISIYFHLLEFNTKLFIQFRVQFKCNQSKTNDIQKKTTTKRKIRNKNHFTFLALTTERKQLNSFWINDFWFCFFAICFHICWRWLIIFHFTTAFANDIFLPLTHRNDLVNGGIYFSMLPFMHLQWLDV